MTPRAVNRRATTAGRYVVAMEVIDLFGNATKALIPVTVG